ncbi:hypothetical protein [Polycladomyces subterraneus]|uniref:Uncharacterized protein n=1 Tax=Polycladomyces subterraneus TaxID=1016997 RepID=A0ABT8IR37_9BACL|nr:hypothetical protein [Polycladomyces subterraneus]MDN4595263.1 hypothetical protein [Polycladomyces subterraneus]
MLRHQTLPTQPAAITTTRALKKIEASASIAQSPQSPVCIIQRNSQS